MDDAVWQEKLKSLQWPAVLHTHLRPWAAQPLHPTNPYCLYKSHLHYNSQAPNTQPRAPTFHPSLSSPLLLSPMPFYSSHKLMSINRLKPLWGALLVSQPRWGAARNTIGQKSHQSQTHAADSASCLSSHKSHFFASHQGTNASRCLQCLNVLHCVFLSYEDTHKIQTNWLPQNR